MKTRDGVVGNLRSPAECFVELWKVAERDLASVTPPILGRPAPTHGTVGYQVNAAGLDGGNYDWNDGVPVIRLFRPTAVPRAPYDPDLGGPHVLDDACTLAHELGHFRSDRDGSRTQADYNDLGAGITLTQVQKDRIVAEERAAWALGRRELEQLGCNEWHRFDQRELDGVGGYAKGLAELPTAPP